MLIYRSDVDREKPYTVQCEAFGWPHRDADGKEMFDNTCFKTIAEAWTRMEREVDAELHFDVRRYDAAVKELRESESAVSETASRRERIVEGIRQSKSECVPTA